MARKDALTPTVTVGPTPSMIVQTKQATRPLAARTLAPMLMVMVGLTWMMPSIMTQLNGQTLMAMALVTTLLVPPPMIAQAKQAPRPLTD